MVLDDLPIFREISRIFPFLSLLRYLEAFFVSLRVIGQDVPEWEEHHFGSS